MSPASVNIRTMPSCMKYILLPTVPSLMMNSFGLGLGLGLAKLVTARLSLHRLAAHSFTRVFTVSPYQCDNGCCLFAVE